MPLLLSGVRWFNPLKVHDNPEEALSDGPNMVYLNQFEDLLKDLVAIDKIVKR